MKAAELHAVEARLDVLREVLVELIATLPPERGDLNFGAQSAGLNIG